MLLIRCAILQQFLHIYIISWEQCTLLVLSQQVDIHCIDTKLNTTYIDIAVFVLGCPCQPSLLSVFPFSNFNDVLLYILGIHGIKLIFGYVYCSIKKTFPKL